MRHQHPSDFHRYLKAFNGFIEKLDPNLAVYLNPNYGGVLPEECLFLGYLNWETIRHTLWNKKLTFSCKDIEKWAKSGGEIETFAEKLVFEFKMKELK